MLNLYFYGKIIKNINKKLTMLGTPNSVINSINKPILNIPKIQKEDLWITDMYAFTRNNTNKKWELKKSLFRSKELISKIIIYLDENYSNKIDPIQYLKHLYYNEENWFSVDVIANRFDHDIRHLYDFLNEILWWELRDKNERTETWIKRGNKSLNTTWLTKNRNKKSNNALAKFNNELTFILENDDDNNDDIKSNYEFNIEEYNKIDWKYRKIIYLMSIVLNFDIKKTIKTINDLRNIVSSMVIAREFNIKLLSFFEINGIEKFIITENNIEEIDNKYSFSKYNEVTYEEVDVTIIKKSDTKFRFNYDKRNMKWIHSIEDLNELQKNTPEHIKKNLIKRLADLEIVINLIYPNNNKISSIDYIIFLYHVKKYSFREMSNHLTELWVKWQQWTLEKNIRLFWWKR